MIELDYTRSPDVVKTVTSEDNLVSVMVDVPERILTAASYMVFGDDGLGLLVKEKKENLDSPVTPGKVDEAYEPEEPVKMDKIDCVVDGKNIAIHRYYSSDIDSDRICFMDNQDKYIYMLLKSLGRRITYDTHKGRICRIYRLHKGVGTKAE